MYNIIQLNDKDLSELQIIAKDLGIKKALSGMMTRYKEVSELFHYFEKISTARFIIKGRTVTVK